MKRHLDQWGLFEKQKFNGRLSDSLKEVFQIPSVTDSQEVGDRDLVLDILVPKHQSGDYWQVSGAIDFPIFWRPKIRVDARLSEYKSGKVKSVYSVTAKMKWTEYLSRLLTVRGILRISPLFDYGDMENLLFVACRNLINKMERQK